MFRSLYPNAFEAELAANWRMGATGAISEARDALSGLRDAIRGAAHPAAEACAALHLAWFSFQSGGQIEPGLEAAALARRIFENLAAVDGQAAAVSMEAWLLAETGLTEDASQEARAALALLGPTSHPGIRAFVINVLGVVLWCCRQVDQAVPFCEEAVRLATKDGDPIATAWWRINLAGVHAAIGYRALAQQQDAEAQQILSLALAINAEALAGAAAAGDRWCQHLALCNAAEYLCATGRIEEALDHLDRCGAIAWDPIRRSRTHYLFTRAEALLRAGRPTEALPFGEQSLRRAEQAGDAEAQMQSLRSLSSIYEKFGDHAEALVYFKRFFDTYQQFTSETARRHARLTGIRYETQRLREKAEAAEAQVASLVVAAGSDALTGLANRRVLDKAMAELVEQPRPYALALLDLDRFKAINDTFSHQVGDAVLQQVGMLMATLCPPGVLPARLGGEEFMLVMPDMDREDALRLCETMRRRIAGHAWDRHHPSLKVTTSIGIACHDEADHPHAVLARADERLYEAKRAGRNRIVAGSIKAGRRSRPARGIRA